MGSKHSKILDMTIPAQLEWMTRGACKALDTADFYPEDDAEVSNQVRITCSMCPVLDECRDYGIRHEMHGVWGGLTNTERIAMRKHLRIRYAPFRPDNGIPVHTGCGTDKGYAFIRRYYARRPELTPVTCPACTDAHSRYVYEKHETRKK
jgi:WhiB family redox-sensing transcriptional regulator